MSWPPIPARMRCCWSWMTITWSIPGRCTSRWRSCWRICRRACGLWCPAGLTRRCRWRGCGPAASWLSCAPPTCASPPRRRRRCWARRRGRACPARRWRRWWPAPKGGRRGCSWPDCRCGGTRMRPGSWRRSAAATASCWTTWLMRSLTASPGRCARFCWRPRCWSVCRESCVTRSPAWPARLVERHVETLLGRSEGATLRRWLSALPAESVRDRPRLCLAQAYGAAMGFQLEALEALLDDAERAFAVSGDEPYEDPAGRPVSVLANVPAGIAFLRASLARLRGDAALAAGYNRQALDQLGEDDWLMRSFVRWNRAVADWLGGRLGPAERGLAEVLAERRAADEAVRRVGGEPTEVLRAVEGGAEFFAGFLAMRVCYDLGEVQRARGNLDAALATYRQALDTAGESSQPAHTGLAHVGLAQVLYERNELTAALDHATRGVTLCRQLAFTPPLATGLAVVARIRHAHGDAAGALEAMGEAGQAGLSPQVITLLNPVPSQRARLLLAQGDVHAAAQWTTAAGLSPDDEPDYPQEPAYLVLARVLLAQNDPGPALTLLQRLLDAAASQGRTGSIIEIQALRALALAACGDHASAIGALTEALTPACRHGYVRVLADEGAPMHALLAQLSAARPGQQHAAHRIDRGYLAALLRACGQADATPPPGRAAAAPPGLAEPLTDRELEVLRLLAVGRSNQRIAHDLVVALDTVKKHVTHILGKLGAANRTEAAARARQLGLIP